MSESIPKALTALRKRHGVPTAVDVKNVPESLDAPGVELRSKAAEFYRLSPYNQELALTLQFAVLLPDYVLFVLVLGAGHAEASRHYCG